MPPQRIALVALVVLLAGGAAWWWQSNNDQPGQPEPVPASAPDASVAVVPRPASPQHAVTLADDASKRCGMAIRDAFNARALQLRNTQDGASQLAYALAVPVDASLNWRAMTREAQRRAMQQRVNEDRRAFRRAAALARGDGDVLWVLAHKCVGGEDCNAARRELRQAEAGNMLVWLREMEEASRNDDPVATRLAFERAASAPEYDAHTDAVQSIIRKAYGTLPLPVACADEGVQRAMQSGMGIDLGRPFGVFDHAMSIAAINAPMPTFGALRKHCAADAGMDSQRREACRGILVRLAEGDTWLERMVALNVLIQLLGDDPEAAAWRERYRERLWMMPQLADDNIRSLLQPEDYWNDEPRSVQAALQIAGRWPPPADWLPEDERARSLVLTGRPPPEKEREQAGAR